MAVYRVFGITIETDLPVVHNLIKAKTNDSINVRVTYFPKPWPEHNLAKKKPVYESLSRSETGDALLSIYMFQDYYILNYANVVRFYLLPQQIYYQPLESWTYLQAETYLLSGVLAIWLELRGTVCLHASAVVVDQFGIGFLSDSGGGKTTLAMSMLQAGYPLLSDDILSVRQLCSEFSAQPAFPTMRTWPDQAKHFIKAPEELTRVVPGYEKRLLPIGTGIFGQFAFNPVPIRRFYLLERLKSESKKKTKILPVPPSWALIELIKQSFAARAAEGLGLSNHRLGILANLARNVSMRKLVYPTGIEILSEVRQAILEDLM